MSNTNYPAWLASLTESQRTVWQVMIDDCPTPEAILEDWAEDHNGQRWFATLACDGSIDVRATEYDRWEELGMDASMQRHEMEYVNQEEHGADSLRGEWFIADDDTWTILHGTFGNYNSPGASHYTYGTLYSTETEYRAALAEWEGKPEYLESDDEWEENEEADEEGDWAEEPQEGEDGWDDFITRVDGM